MVFTELLKIRSYKVSTTQKLMESSSQKSQAHEVFLQRDFRYTHPNVQGKKQGHARSTVILHTRRIADLS